MSGISDTSDGTLESWRKCFQQQIHSAMSPISPGTLLVWIAEIRSLRAENKELRASYERVDKHATEVRLLCEKQAELCEKQADMIRKINPLYR